jgi:nucleoside-diphosphate-sugar epimerase
MTGTILITGATGIIGIELVREFLRRHDPPTLLLLLRGNAEEVQAKKRWVLQWAEVSPEKASFIDVVPGDVTVANLGISESTRNRIGPIGGIIHAAAGTRFDQSREVAFLNNVIGTRNLLAFARSCPRLDRVAIVSTAFVAGRRAGLIRENELDFRAGFNNEYEHSKALSELEAQSFMGDLPIAIYRLSLVVGRSEDGRISRLTGLYPVLRLFHEGLLAMIGGDRDQSIDLIPADFASRAVIHLYENAFAPGMTCHVCAGRDRSFALGDLFPAVDECLARSDPSWRRRGQPLPEMVGPEIFRDFVDIVELTGNPRLRNILQQMRTVTRMLETPRVFDTTVFDRALAGNGIVLPHASKWLETIVARGVETRWQQPARLGEA